MPKNYTLLSESPLTKSDQCGDTRNTTWGSENGAAPTFNNAYARTLLERDYVSGLDMTIAALMACACGQLAEQMRGVILLPLRLSSASFLIHVPNTCVPTCC